MIRRLIAGQLAKFERRYDYDMSYARDILDADLGAFLKCSRLRQFADVAFDAHEPLRLDDRPDVVEHGAGDRGGPDRGQQHRQDAAARRADEHSRK